MPAQLQLIAPKEEQPATTFRQMMARRVKLVALRTQLSKMYTRLGRRLATINAEIKAIDAAVVK